MAKEQNLSILSYLANELNSPVITIAAPIIAFVAITKSFLGHYIGAFEVMRDMIIKFGKSRGKVIEEKQLRQSFLLLLYYHAGLLLIQIQVFLDLLIL